MKELEQLQKEHQELGNRIQELKDSLSKPKGFDVALETINKILDKLK